MRKKEIKYEESNSEYEEESGKGSRSILPPKIRIKLLKVEVAAQCLEAGLAGSFHYLYYS